MINLRKILKLGAGHNLIVAVAAILIQILTMSFLARYQKELIGVYALIEICSAWLIAFFFFGGEQYFINFKNKSNYRIFNLVKFNILLVFIGAVILGSILTFFDIYSILLVEGLNTFPILSLVLCTFFISSIAIIASAFRSDLSIFEAALCEKSFIFFFCITIVSSILLFPEFMTLKSAVNIALVVSAIIFVFWLYRCNTLCREGRESKFNELKKEYFSREGLYFFFTGIFIVIFERIDQAIILSAFGLIELGGYFACYKLAFAVRFVTKSINSAIFPYLSKFNNNNPVEGLLLHLETKNINFAIAAIFCVPLFLFSESILLIIFGSDFIQYSTVLQIIAIALVISASNQVDFNLLNSLGKSKSFFINSVLTVTVQLIVIGLLFESHGIIGLAFARLCSVFIGLIYSQYLLYKEGIALNRTVNTICIIIFILSISRGF